MSKKEYRNIKVGKVLAGKDDDGNPDPDRLYILFGPNTDRDGDPVGEQTDFPLKIKEGSSLTLFDTRKGQYGLKAAVDEGRLEKEDAKAIYAWHKFDVILSERIDDEDEKPRKKKSSKSKKRKQEDEDDDDFDF